MEMLFSWAIVLGLGIAAYHFGPVVVITILAVLCAISVVSTLILLVMGGNEAPSRPVSATPDDESEDIFSSRRGYLHEVDPLNPYIPGSLANLTDSDHNSLGD